MKRKFYTLVLTFLCLFFGQLSFGQGIGELGEVIVYGWCHPLNSDYDHCTCHPEDCVSDSGECTDITSSTWPCAAGAGYLDTGDCNDERSYAFPCDQDDCLNDCECLGIGCPDDGEEDDPCEITSCPDPADEVINCECVKKQEPADCTMEVVNKIQNVIEPVFKKIIDRFNDPNLPYKVNFSNAALTSGDMAITQNSNVRGTINIVTNKNYTNETSLMATAVVLHEYVHAYFNTLWFDWKDNQNTLVYNDYPVLKKYFIDGTYSGVRQDAHHEQIADSFINNIAAALKELEPGLPDQYYKDVAWATLDKTPVYYTDLSQPDRDRIKPIRECEVTGVERELKPKGKPCIK